MTLRFINGWRTGNDILDFILLGGWYIKPAVFGYTMFGFVLLNFGVNISLRD